MSRKQYLKSCFRNLMAQKQYLKSRFPVQVQNTESARAMFYASIIYHNIMPLTEQLMSFPCHCLFYVF